MNTISRASFEGWGAGRYSILFVLLVFLAAGSSAQAADETVVRSGLADPGTEDIDIPDTTINLTSSLVVDHGPKNFNGTPSGGVPASKLVMNGTNTILDIDDAMTGAITLNNMHLEGGYHSDAGGAIRYNGGGTLQLDVTSSHFEGNTGETNGGAIYVNGTWDGDITGASFSNNSTDPAIGGGGGIAVNGELAGSIQNSTFTGNTSYNNGGGVYVYVSGTYAGKLGGIFGSTFTGNSTSSGNGGAVYADAIENGIHDSTFKENKAGFWGGGVYVHGTLAGGVTNCWFEDNESSTINLGGYSGNAINAGIIEGGVHGSTFINNTGGTDGGGAIMARNTLHGGVTDSVFRGNEAGMGGALYAYNGFGSDAISKTEFSNNSATGTGASAGRGGAIYLMGGEVTVHNSTFQENEAGVAGGGIYARAAAVTLKADGGEVLLFSGNTAGSVRNSLHFEREGTLLVDTDAGSAVNMEDAMSANITGANTLAITKAGAGTWYLAGTSTLATAAATGIVDFGVSAGTLHLYGAGDATGVSTDAEIILQGTDSQFVVGGAGQQAFLSVGGDNSIQSDGSIILADKGVIASQTKPNASLTLATASGKVGVEGTGYVQVASGGQLGLDAELEDNSSASTLRKVGDGVLDLTRQDALYGVSTTALDAGKVQSSQDQGFKELLTAAGTELDIDGDLTVESGEMRGSSEADALIKISTGTLTLYGAANYSGGSRIDQGTVIARAIGVLGSEETAIDAGGRLVLEHDGLFDNDVSGAGVMETKGNLYLAGDMLAHSGEVQITLGKLGLGASDGTTADSGALFRVGNGTTLFGNGQMRELHVAAGGVVSPGHSLGTIQVNGDAVFQAGSVYEVEVNPLDQTEADLIYATGQVDLGGATVRHIGFGPESSYPQEGRWLILRADTGYGTSRFSDQVQHNFLFLDEFLEYPNPQEVYLRILRNGRGFTDFEDLTPNQFWTGQGLDSLDDGSLKNDLIGLPADTYMPDVLDSLSGEIHPTIRTALQDYDRSFGQTMLARIFDQPTCPVPCAMPIWFEAQGYDDRIKGHYGVAQAQMYGYNAAMGAEKRFAGGWTLGGAFRYGHHNLRVKNRWSRGNIDSYTFGLYGGRDFAFDRGVLRWSFGASYGYHDIDTTRDVTHPNLRQTLTADYHTQTAQALTDVGFRLGDGPIIWEPFARLAWNSAWSSHFTEKGGNGALRSRSEHLGNLTHVLGLRMSTAITEKISFNGGLGWMHAHGDVDSKNRFAFRQGSDVFTIEGVSVPRDAAQINAGINVKLAENMNLVVAYDGYLGRKTQQHAGRAAFQYVF